MWYKGSWVGLLLETPASVVEMAGTAPVVEVQISERQSNFTDNAESTDNIDNIGSRDISRTRRLFHSLGLGSLYLLVKEVRGHVVHEERKIVLIHDFWTACYVSLLHIIPIAASVTLLVLNLRGYYIGGDLSGANGAEGTSIRLLILQFLSKLLELLAVASLSCILFALIRHSLIFGELPYGALTAGFEFTKISILWSKEFIAFCSTSFDSRRTKILLVASTVVFSILGVSLGPSFATTLQPTLQNFHGGGTSYYLPNDLWPLQLSKMEPPEIACTSLRNQSCFPANHNLISEELLSYWPTSESLEGNSNSPQVMPEQTLISGRKSLRELAVRFRGPFQYQPFLSAATTQSALIADVVAKLSEYWFDASRFMCSEGDSSFCFYKDILYSIKAMQPVAYTSCNINSVNSTLRFPRIDQEVGSFPLLELENSNFTSLERYNEVTGNGSVPDLAWINLPQSRFGLSSVGAIVTLPGTEDFGQTLACTVDARWANSTTVMSFTGGPMVVRGEPEGWYTTSRLRKKSTGELKWPSISISPQWAHNLNPVIEGLNISVFTLLSESTGQSGNISSVTASVNAVEAILAVMVAEGLSRTANNATIQGSLKADWKAQMLPRNTVFGTAGSAVDYTYVPGDPFKKFEMQTTVNGYGYGITTATILSSIVLLTYTLVATVYVVHSTCFSKSTSSAWESISEVIALAMNSTPEPALRNTGAGISSLKTFKENIQIGVNDDEQLQMIFVGTPGGEKPEKAGLETVTRNESYR